LNNKRAYCGHQLISEGTEMSILKPLLLIVPLALAGVAKAQPSHLTDAQYLAAVRCQTLMASTNLGREDTHAIDALVKSASADRAGAAYDRGESVREDAAQAARHAGAFSKAALLSERDGLCRAVTGVVSEASVPSSTPNRTN
jgi:hypothetical protein